MVTIDRMEIDDVGANPRKLAEAITKQLPDNITSTPLLEIAKAIDIYEVREERLDGLEGCLIVPEDKSEGAILVNKSQDEPRKRYTIAHEIGHYVNPMHRSSSPDGFRCTRSDMSVDSAKAGDAHAKMELEANQFAAYLLMPDRWVTAFMRGKGVADLEHIYQMATQFEVSKEAAARKYIAKQDEPTAIVFSHNNRIRYIKKNDDFPRLSVWGGQSIPSASLSANSTAPQGEITDVVEALGHLWLENSRNISLGEQTVAQRNGYRMTLLTAELDEEDEDAWEPPKFRR